MRVLIVGHGRVGGSLARALRRAGQSVRIVRGRARAPLDPSGWDALLLCVPDSEIAVVARRVVPSQRALVAHCSGALDLAPLMAVERAGGRTGSLHPLQAVPTRSTRLTGWAAIDASSRVAARVLARIARAAGLSPFLLGGESRALYHAAASLASNGLVGLAAQATSVLERSGVATEDATPALFCLMRSALEAAEAHGLWAGLTGPIARGDAATVRAHLAALSRLAPDALDCYRALALAQLRLSGAPPAAVRSIRRALKEPGTARARGRRRARSAAPAR